MGMGGKAKHVKGVFLTVKITNQQTNPNPNPNKNKNTNTRAPAGGQACGGDGHLEGSKQLCQGRDQHQVQVKAQIRKRRKTQNTKYKNNTKIHKWKENSLAKDITNTYMEHRINLRNVIEMDILQAESDGYKLEIYSGGMSRHFSISLIFR